MRCIYIDLAKSCDLVMCLGTSLELHCLASLQTTKFFAIFCQNMAENPTDGNAENVRSIPEMEVSGRPASLEKALHRTVDRFTSSIGLSLFKKHYRKLYEQDRVGMRTIHRQFVKGLHSKITEDVQADIAEQDLLKRLKTLDDLVSATEETETDQKEAWRPSGNPVQDLTPHRIAVKLKTKEEIQENQENLQREDDTLKAKVTQKRKMLTDMQDQLETKLKHFKKAASACQEQPVTDMSKYLAKSNNVISPKLL